jgi:tetratricopeptide (TPR) repeat protein
MSSHATAIRSQAHHLYRQGDIEAAVDMLVAAWLALPAVRERQPTASAIAAELANISLYDLKDTYAAEHWTDMLARCSGPHAAAHELALLRMRIDLARGNKDAARHHLAAAFAIMPPAANDSDAIM